VRIRCAIEGGASTELKGVTEHHQLDDGVDKYRVLLGGLYDGALVQVIRVVHEDGRPAVKIMPVTGSANSQGIFDFHAWFRVSQAPTQ